MRRHLLLSAALHLAVLAALAVGVSPSKRFPEPEETGIPVELMIALGPTAPAEVAAAPAEEPVAEAPTPTPDAAPQPAPPAPSPPPPPPPPPPSPPPPVPPSPAPPPPAAPPPPRPAEPAPAPPPPPPPPPAPPALPAPPAPPPPVQTPPVQRPQEGSTALQNTLERLRRQQAMQAPPRPPSPQPDRPPAAGAPGGTAPQPGLTRGEIDGLANRIADCWSVDAGLRGLEEIVVELQARFRPAGQGVAVVSVRPARGLELSDPRVRTVYESAQRALLNPRCEPLPVPPEKIAALEQATFRFNARGLVR